MKSGSTGVGESHQAITKGESGSMGSLSLRISAAKSNWAGFGGALGGRPPVEAINTACDVRSGQYSAKVCAMMLPSECPTRSAFLTPSASIKLLMDALGVKKDDLVGHSLGSIIAQTFAEYWPERTSHAVLIASTGGRPPNAPPKPPQFDFAADIRKLKEPIEPDSPFMIAWWDSPTPVDPHFIRRQRKDAAGIPLRVWLAVLDQGLPDNAYDDLQRTLPRLKAPTLLIWGSKDPIMEEPVRKTLRDALPGAKVKVFEGLGHNPFWEDPRGVAEVINTFLAG